VRLMGADADVAVARKVLEELYGLIRAGNDVQSRDVREAIKMITQKPDVDLREVYEDVLSSVLGATVVIPGGSRPTPYGVSSLGARAAPFNSRCSQALPNAGHIC